MLDLLREIERELGGHPDEVSEAERIDAAATHRAVGRVLRAFAVVVALLFVFSSERLVTSRSDRCRTGWWRLRPHGMR